MGGQRQGWHIIVFSFFERFFISKKIFIKDIRSSNGTFVNGERLSSEGQESEPFELRSDDILVRALCLPLFDVILNTYSQEFGVDIVGEDDKTIIYHKVVARVVCVFNEQDAQVAARAEQYRQKQKQKQGTPAKEERRRAEEDVDVDVDVDGWSEWQGIDNTGTVKQNIQEGAGESEFDDRKEEEFEVKEEASVVKSEDQCQDEREANAGDRNSKKLKEPKEEQVLIDKNTEKAGQLDGQENEKPCWVTPLQNGPAIILPKRKESNSLCCGCIVM